MDIGVLRVGFYVRLAIPGRWNPLQSHVFSFWAFVASERRSVATGHPWSPSVTATTPADFFDRAYKQTRRYSRKIFVVERFQRWGRG